MSAGLMKMQVRIIFTHPPPLIFKRKLLVLVEKFFKEGIKIEEKGREKGVEE